jgi:uncharacterized membrane protein
METIPETKTIEIDQQILNNLNNTRKWTMFLAIIGFILIGMMVVVGAITGTFLSVFNSVGNSNGVPEYIIFAIFLLLVGLCLFPVIFLFRFSKHTAKAIQTFNRQELHKAFKYLKFYFAYLGVLIIIALTFYVAAIIFAGTSIPFLRGL